MARRSYRCPNCKKQTLEFCDSDDTEPRYVCPKSVNFDFGVGCAHVYTVSELETLEGDDDCEEEEDDDVSDCNSEDDFTDDDDYKENESQKSDEEGDPDRGLKNKNIAALLRGDLVVRRQSLIPKALSFSDGAAIARQPFKSPCSNAQEKSKEELTRRLHARKRFVPWGSQSPASVPVAIFSPVSLVTKNEQSQDDISLPPGIEPLVLWQPEDIVDGENKPIVVDPILVRFLRPHQREGVQFMFDCVAGLKDFSKVDRSLAGCILADDMGLGKTLQSITLLYTLLRQGFDGKPMAKRVIIVTPTSLVGNWESEIQKWLEGRLQVIAMCESSRADVISGITSFLSPCSPFQVMIISYETFRMHASKFEKEESCSLLICDEAHRLKNDQTITNRALANLKCNRRILLSGTPMQNDLEEFFAMVNFTNPGILGNATSFRRYYELPIIRGREPTATEEERLLGVQRSTILSEKVNQFILRRTNALLSNHLPPKIVEVVCCKLTELQLKLYRHFIESKNVKQVLQDQTRRCKVLASITALKKLCNHPKLIYDSVRGGNSEAAGFENCISLFPQEMFAGRSGSWSGGDGSWVKLSGKMYVLARLLAFLYEKTDDRIVLVSNYTQTLDLFAQLCRERNYPFLRLDGTTSINKRRKLVQKFNDPSQNEFAFLLSSKAGGCGLNLIGGNRLVLFDPDWNPANDKQAAARVWRDGQKKRVYIYRFLATGTIEEKVYQRQMSKEGLQKVVQQGNEEDPKGQVNSLSMEDLRDLFTLQDSIRSEIHENLNCERCLMDASQDEQSKALESSHEAHGQDLSDIGGFAEISGLHNLKSSEKQLGSPSEEDLQSWGHHSSSSTVPDLIFQAAAGNEVSFVFTNQVDGKLAPIESGERKHLVARGIGHRTVLGAEKQVGSRVLQRQGLASESMHRKEGATHSSKPLTEFNKGIQPTRNTSQYPAANTKPFYSNLTDRKMSKLNVSSALQKTHVPMKRMFPDSDLSENDFCT